MRLKEQFGFKMINKIFLFFLKKRLQNPEVCKIYGYYPNGSLQYKLNYFVENLEMICIQDAYFIAGPYFASKFFSLINDLDKAKYRLNYE